MELDPSLLGRLKFQHTTPTKEPLPKGRHLLGLSAIRDAILYVPPGIDPTQPVPLLVLFHGGGGSPDRMLPALEEHAAHFGFLVLAPHSVERTWDLLLVGNGPDLHRLDTALAEVASRFVIDRDHLGFAGFSDGASYSLSIGLTNGDFVTHVMAFSPGRVDLFAPEGDPPILISHGYEDEQLPFEKTRDFASKLQEGGYQVNFIEFRGRHVLLPPIVNVATNFFLMPR